MAPRLAALAVAVVLTSSCATWAPTFPASSGPPLQTSVALVTLHGTPLEIHLSAPVSLDPTSPLVLYASGDGGWVGAAVSMFHAIATHGHPMVGFSSRALMKIERPAHAQLTAHQLAADYATILTAARRLLGLPTNAPAILTGWSRGAAFATIAASEPGLLGQIDGVIAIGLAADEDLGVDGPGDKSDDDPIAEPAAHHGALQPYARLRQSHGRRSAVIQATGDGYLPAAAARRLFGPDTDDRRLFEVTARNHRFSGGEAAFVAALDRALSWVSRSSAPIH